LTQDKKTLIVDNYAKWRISDPLKVLQTVQNEIGAQARLEDIIYSELRAELGRHAFHNIISKTRAEIMLNVTKKCNEITQDYGIDVLDVRIKRADLPQENENAIFARMEAERNRIANQYRSEGEEEALKSAPKLTSRRRLSSPNPNARPRKSGVRAMPRRQKFMHRLITATGISTNWSAPWRLTINRLTAPPR